MITIPGYTLISPLSESGDLILYRANRMRDGLPVLIKLTSAPGQSPSILARLEHEYKLARDLDPVRIARPLALERHGGNVALILEQGPTKTLASLLGSPMDIGSFLRIAIGINAALAELHSHGIVHKDLKPEHVLLDEAGHIWLSGLGIASRLPREHQPPEPPEAIDGTLAYMAPEQTGRMNRSIDSRSDLYALGVTFYQMLTGELPFTADDPMAWVHCHVARQPVPLTHHVPDIPEALSEIVMKLLAKTSEERYQGAAGLDVDLKRCLAQWASDGRIDLFPLGEHDALDRLLIPEKLYGRKAETEALLAIFNRIVTTGAPELVLVSGYAGIGKTSVVQELHKALVPHRGRFAAGKFDQYKRNIPYATLIQALQTLVRQILGKNEAEVERWRDAMQEALSPNGQLIVNLIPEVEMIVGKQPPVPDLPPQEARNRFQMVLMRFIGVFAGPDHPLAIFLDDLQWLDAATLELIEQLVVGAKVRHLLLIGAYRDNEVGPTHPLIRVIDTVRNHGADMQEIVLAPLTRDDVGGLIEDTLHCDRERAHSLAQVVHEKTGGNPFFIIQFLASLNEADLLAYDQGAGHWTWDLARIHARGFTDNVVDLMVEKLGRLPEATREALKQFACLGNTAEIVTLTMIYGQSEEALHAALWEAARTGLIVRQEHTYVFLHDRVQEAAYALVPETRRKELHLKIGRLLLAHYSPEVLTERVFDVIDHFNRSVELVTDAEERAALRRLNTAAGRKAQGAVAHASARYYLEQAMALLPADAWDEHYAESLALFLELAECEYLTGDFKRSDERLTMALEKSRATLDRVRAFRLRQRLYQVSGRWPEALDAALQGLARLGVSFPDSDEEIRAATEAEIALIQVNLRGRCIADLADEPFTDDVEIQALLGLLTEAMPQSFAVRPELWPLIIARSVNLCLQHGHVEESTFVYGSYCMVLVGVYRDIPTAFQFSLMSLALNERIPGGGGWRGRPALFHASVVNIWCQHFRESLPLLDQAFHLCHDSGDLLWACNLSYHAIWLHLENGDPLDRVVEIARRFATFNQQHHNDTVATVNQAQQQFALSLAGKTRTLTDFSDDIFDEAACVAALEQAGFGIGVAFYCIMKQVAAYHAGCFEDALVWADRATPTLSHVTSMANEATHHFYHALTLAALYGKAPTRRQQKLRKRLTVLLERHQFWMNHCPENFANRCFLVSAEIARIQGRDSDAMGLYDQAICSARDNDFVHHEALAAEIASRFYRQRGFLRIADAYLGDAHAGYLRWGAQGKVRQMEQHHPQLRKAPPLDPATTFTTAVHELDILAAVRASQAISGEIHLDNLLKTLMRIVLETAGAQQGYLLLYQKEELIQAAVARVEQQTMSIHVHGEPGFAEAALPTSILNYVRRSRDQVHLDDATIQHPYAADAYFSHRHPKSVLCFPIVKQIRLIGVIYLENDLATHAFTAGRLAVIKLIATQASISLENARVYEDLRRSEQRFRVIFDQTFQFIGVLTTEGTIIQVNQTGLRFAGLSGDAVLGQPFWETPWWDHSVDMQQRVKAAIKDAASGKLVRFEATHATPAGAVHDIDVSIKPVTDSKGRIIQLISEGRDITERKQAEKEIRKLNQELEQRVRARTAQLEAVNKELEAFAYSVSHDLRTPLRHIDGFVKLLQKRLDESFDASSRQYMTNISDAANRMELLIDDLLSFSRMGRHEMAKTPVDLSALVQEVIGGLEPETQGRTIDWHIGDLPTLRGDAAMLRMVLANLIANALKFTQPRETAQIDIGSLADPNTETVIFVRDNGVGFDMSYSDRLFSVFQRLHRADEFEGTGIGLATVRRIIARHGGRAWAEGALDQGATFYFSLPDAQQGDGVESISNGGKP